MKTFGELTKTDQEWANEQALEQLVQALLQGFRFDDAKNGDGLQAAIDAAIEKADEMQTPWFAESYILEARHRPAEGHVTEDDGLWPVAETLRSMASCDAEDALYLEPDDPPAIRLPRRSVKLAS